MGGTRSCTVYRLSLQIYGMPAQVAVIPAGLASHRGLRTKALPQLRLKYADFGCWRVASPGRGATRDVRDYHASA